MTVPVRGLLLAATLAPVVGTILETHPRACLSLTLRESVGPELRACTRAAAHLALSTLWTRWAAAMTIEWDQIPETDGALDAPVCATVAMLYHRAPGRLRRLRAATADRRGHGPL